MTLDEIRSKMKRHDDLHLADVWEMLEYTIDYIDGKVCPRCQKIKWEYRGEFEGYSVFRCEGCGYLKND